MSYFAAFLAAFVLIFLKATQQRHVQFAQYVRMPPVSYGMAFCEVFITARVATTSDSFWPLIGLALCIGTGASLGSMLGTYLHVRKHPSRS